MPESCSSPCLVAGRELKVPRAKTSEVDPALPPFVRFLSAISAVRVSLLHHRDLRKSGRGRAGVIRHHKVERHRLKSNSALSPSLSLTLFFLLTHSELPESSPPRDADARHTHSLPELNSLRKDNDTTSGWLHPLGQTVGQFPWQGWMLFGVVSAGVLGVPG